MESAPRGCGDEASLGGVARAAMLKPLGSVLAARGTEMELLRCWWVPAGVLTGEEEAALVGEAAEARRCCSRGPSGSLGSSRAAPDRRRRDPTRRHSARPSSIMVPAAVGNTRTHAHLHYTCLTSHASTSLFLLPCFTSTCLDLTWLTCAHLAYLFCLCST